jgi:hypothetical protein
VANRPVTVTINLVFILLNALIWLILAISIAANLTPGLAVPLAMKVGMAIISTAMGCVLLVLTYFLFKHNLKAFYLILAFFVFTSILVIFDDVGLSDIIVLIISLIPVVLLIKDRAWYLQVIPKIKETL